MTKQTSITKRLAATYAAREAAKTQQLIEAIEGCPALEDETAGTQVLRIGRVMLKLSAKPGRAAAMVTALKKIRKPAARRMSGQQFPRFSTGMSTRDYVKQFAMANSDGWGKSAASCKVTIDAFFEPLNAKPCTLYENGALDFDAIEDTDASAAAAVAAVVATALALANAAQAPATKTAFSSVKWCSESEKIGKTLWTLCVYEHPSYGPCTGYSWHDDGAGVWRRDREHARYDGNDTYNGLPVSLAKIFYANEAAINLHLGKVQALAITEPATVRAQGDTVGAGSAPAAGHAAGHQAAHDGASTSGPATSQQAPRLTGPGVQDLDQAPPATIDAAGMLADIPHALARSAHQGISFSPERRGDSARAEYAGTLAEDYAYFHAQAIKGGTLDKLPAEFARYRDGMAGRYRAYLASSSRCVSSFIAGPSNFPAARMNKRADIAHKRLGEYLDGREIARRAVVRNLRPDLRPIMAGDADAAERLAVKIAQAEYVQKCMKLANAAIRKNAKAGTDHQVAALMELGYLEGPARALLARPYRGCGFQAYELTNNNANIRSMRARLEQIERAQAAPITEQDGADGIRLEDDPPANRVRLYFPSKPAADIRDQLKAAGFRWSPTVGAWQAYRNHQGMTTAQRLAGLDHTAAAAGAQDLKKDVPAVLGVQDLGPAAPAAQADAAAAAGPAAGSWDAWQSQIVQLVADMAGIPHSDAAGIVEARAFELAQGWARGTTAQDLAQQIATPAPATAGVQDLDAQAAAAPAKAPKVQDLEQNASTAPAKARQTRAIVPALGQRLASKSGAWEAWFYPGKAGKLNMVFYQGKAFKPTKHFHFHDAGRRMQAFRTLAIAAEQAAAARQEHADSRRAELAKPHGLTVGAVLVHSWGYDQTNIDYYQVTAVIGRRMVAIRAIDCERQPTGDMTGICVPCPGVFTGEAKRAKVTSGDHIRVAGFSRGYAYPLEIISKLPNGAPLYRKHSYSSYA
ncbi:hypothetical protein [Polaromonas sp.]|uniref:hypothetical protein n=1 Tax=Polaromonas sp. TaxID=1869339 RepID=UPI00356438C7